MVSRTNARSARLTGTATPLALNQINSAQMVWREGIPLRGAPPTAISNVRMERHRRQRVRIVRTERDDRADNRAHEIECESAGPGDEDRVEHLLFAAALPLPRRDDRNRNRHQVVAGGCHRTERGQNPVRLGAPQRDLHAEKLLEGIDSGSYTGLTRKVAHNPYDTIDAPSGRRSASIRLPR